MISIIIPIYNQADKIGECLSSIFAQTFKDWEVIIVDDGSTDDFRCKIANIKWRIKNFKIIYQENRGAPAARNRGFKESRGEYLFFCDADAVLRSDALEAMLDALAKNSKASYAYSSFMWGKKFFRVGPFDENKIKTTPCIHTMSLIRREAFPEQGWDESIKKLQDWDLWLAMLRNGRRGIWVDKILFAIKPGGHISFWLPSFAYKIFPFLPSVKKYKTALEIIKKKHGL